MNFLRCVLAGVTITIAAGCVSTSSSETRTPTNDPVLADARRRAEAHTSLAAEYYARGIYGVALSETKLAIKDDPSFVAAWNMQGLVLMELREDTMAREAFDRALRMDPNNSEVLNNYGWFVCVRGEHARGLEMLRRAGADPLYPTPEKAYLSAGLCMRRAGRSAEAETQLRAAVSIRPDLLGALFNLAELSYERGAMKDAENFITRYMRIASPNADALLLAVKIARANNDKIAEESYLQQMRRRFPDSAQSKEVGIAPSRN
ncbi:type IV pilus biogenesis/stability protein PilW [Usitatibacter palustris]|uniref:Uncharacterized protein n=1 Tax=Usitatibacter palustris TaxID=2732487 RepID=A0A6M4H920_9PROT|nr:type IV pilus biogenesis/stability protein PilW [Usitatibacter palustris]QJR15705.1 hypothetical protein DSM104440_02531 [Usitatibacter palustris]